MSELETARLYIRGVVADLPVDERSKIEAALARLRACVEEESKGIRALTAMLLFFDYSKELGIE